MSNQKKVVPTLCTGCLTSCGVNAHVEDGKLVRITPLKEHVFNKLCIKSSYIPDVVHAKDRITHPLKKTDGVWKQISLGEALDTIADKLTITREKHGPKALAIVTGLGMFPHMRVAPRFASAYGTPNYSSGISECAGASEISGVLTIGRDAALIGENFEGSRCVVVWGTNLHHSDLRIARGIESARKKGAKLIVIDPRRTRLARDADIHIQVRPGSDCALALSILYVIITEELYDKDFVENWTIGFEQLRDHVKEYTPEIVEKLTWVPAGKIREIARIYATHKPGAIARKFSVEHCVSGVQYRRATDILIAITGNLDIKGGNVYYPPFRLRKARLEGALPLSEAIGAIRWPLFSRLVGEDQGLAVPDAIIKGQPYPIKSVINQNCNPCMNYPNSQKVREAYGKLDFLVVHDFFMTETAKLADIFLPAVHVVEQDVLYDYSFQFTPYLFLGRKALDPPSGCIHDWELWLELAKRMGYRDFFPWGSLNELYQWLLEPTTIPLEKLKENSAGLWHMDPNKTKRYLGKGFLTPSGKVEIFSKTMKDYGYDPLPVFKEPAQSSVNEPGLVEKYPFIMLTGTREHAFFNSMHHNLAKALERTPEPLIEINTSSAREAGITHGDMVVIESLHGTIEMKANVTDDIHPKVVSIPKGWPQANVNFLIDDEERDPITGYPAFRTQICRVRKAG
jgi:anaerobic selenocysteine-containing dehydrogenase